MWEKKVLRGATRWLQEDGDRFRGWVASLVTDRLGLLVTVPVEPRSGWSVVRKGMVTGSCYYTKSVVQFEMLELRGKRFQFQINTCNLGEHCW